MAPKNDVRAQLEEHGWMMEQHQIELHRLRRQIELSVRRTADLQAAVDRLRLTAQRAERVASAIKAPARSLPAKRARAN